MRNKQTILIAAGFSVGPCLRVLWSERPFILPRSLRCQEGARKGQWRSALPPSSLKNTRRTEKWRSLPIRFYWTALKVSESHFGTVLFISLSCSTQFFLHPNPTHSFYLLPLSSMSWGIHCECRKGVTENNLSDWRNLIIFCLLYRV